MDNAVLDKYKERTTNKTMNNAYEYMDEVSVDSDLICNICHSPFKDPHCTPCSETFCRECITNWIQTQNASCPHCRQALSVSVLTQAPRSLRNMLDRLRVKCIFCEQNGLQRANFDEHIRKVCPKTVVSCPSADIKCPWTGQRDQLNQHLATCHFEPMRPVITELIVENQQLKDHINQQTTRNSEQQNENQQLREQIGQLRTQVTSCLRENQRLQQQLREKGIQTTSMSSRSRE
jgi:hypothetical protein